MRDEKTQATTYTRKLLQPEQKTILYLSSAYELSGFFVAKSDCGVQILCMLHVTAAGWMPDRLVQELKEGTQALFRATHTRSGSDLKSCFEFALVMRKAPDGRSRRAPFVSGVRSVSR